jgi:hypothetical protein
VRNTPIKQNNFHRELNEQIIQTHRKCTGKAILCYRLVNIEEFLTSIQIKSNRDDVLEADST